MLGEEIKAEHGPGKSKRMISEMELGLRKSLELSRVDEIEKERLEKVLSEREHLSFLRS
jgi:hypothetical protein